jgi:hypothetical protein
VLNSSYRQWTNSPRVEEEGGGDGGGDRDGFITSVTIPVGVTVTVMIKAKTHSCALRGQGD